MWRWGPSFQFLGISMLGWFAFCTFTHTPAMIVSDTWGCFLKTNLPPSPGLFATLLLHLTHSKFNVLIDICFCYFPLKMWINQYWKHEKLGWLRIIQKSCNIEIQKIQKQFWNQQQQGFQEIYRQLNKTSFTKLYAIPILTHWY